MTRIDEIATDIFRISTYVPEFNLQFNQFLIRDEEPLLFETGMKQMFPLVREAVAKIIDPASASLRQLQSLRAGRMWLAQRMVERGASSRRRVQHCRRHGLR